MEHLHFSAFFYKNLHISQKSSNFAAAMRRVVLLIVCFALACAGSYAFAEEAQEKAPSKGLLFFYRMGNWTDNYLRRGIDTTYIDLPEHSWRFAATAASTGINTSISSTKPDEQWTLLNRSMPSLDVGFYAGYRGIGFGYSWDVLHAYSRRLNFSFGSKYIGLDFSLQKSGDFLTSIAYNNDVLGNLGSNLITVSNANLHIWYALNATHYSHNAAVKQSYIQKKTAGSLLLHLSYMSHQVRFNDTLHLIGPEEGQDPIALLPALMSGMMGMTTRQVALGLGYGINYTPNKGKVLLHASAAMMLVCYSVNHIMYYVPDSLREELPSTAEPMFVLQPAVPVHVTGNVRAAVSWEINRWIHLSAWATGDHIRFRSAAAARGNMLLLSNWSWKVQLNFGVRVGAGRDRLERALGKTVLHQDEVAEIKKSKLPLWMTDFFWSPK